MTLGVAPHEVFLGHIELDAGGAQKKKDEEAQWREYFRKPLRIETRFSEN